MNRYTATMFILIASILVGFIFSNFNMATMTNDYAVHTTIKHTTIKPIFKAQADHNLNIPFLTEYRYAPDSSNIVDMIVSIIPNMLPNTSGECGGDSGISCQ